MADEDQSEKSLKRPQQDWAQLRQEHDRLAAEGRRKLAEQYSRPKPQASGQAKVEPEFLETLREAPMIPDAEDLAAVDQAYPLPADPTNEQRAEQYRLAQANKLLRLYQAWQTTHNS